MNYGTLPHTGATAVVIGGVAFGQFTLVLFALALIILGALIVKATFRSGKDAGAL